MEVSAEKKKRMKYGAIIGAVVGLAIFGVAFVMANSPVYIFFIPFGAAMGWASQYVKLEEEY